MFRFITSALMALALAIAIPMLIPDGSGGTLLSGKKLLADPLLSWKLGYYLDPYRTLYQRAVRLLDVDSGTASEMRAYQDRDGN